MITIINTPKNNLIIMTLLLWNISYCMEYIIITDESLAPAAEMIADVYNNESNAYHIDTEVVLRKLIINDNVSIKEYIQSQIEHFSELEYLLIFGDELLVPSLTKSVVCNDIESEYPSDDFFSSETDESKPRLKTGRIPASNLDEALLFAEKLKYYINNNSVGSWKNTVLLVSDDEIKSGETIQNEINHTINSNLIYDKISDYTFTKTLYGPMYDAEYFGSERRLPGLTEDIIKQLNNGAAIINYIGHGDTEKWSAEHILEKNRDIGLINIPDNKFPIWIAGTCYFGRYDGVDSMAESLLFETNGAISIVGATRAISENINTKFLDHFYSQIADFLTNDDEILRLGDAFFESKINLNNINYKSQCNGGYLFDILGDPALPMKFVKSKEFSSFPSELNILESYNFESQNSYSYIELSEPTSQIEFSFEDDTVSFSYTPKVLFSNEFTDSTCIMLPIDMIDNNSLTIKLFSEDIESFQNSYMSITNDIVITYDNLEEFSNNEGPGIVALYNDFEVQSNSILYPGQNLTIYISDNHGINTSSSIGHNLRYWFNNENDTQIITNDNINFLTSCTEILCNISIPYNLEGTSELYIEAWDNLNMKSNKKISFMVMDNIIENQISNVYNFPNPMSNRTFFTFQTLDYHSSIDTKVEIFTQPGFLINTLQDNSSGNFVSIEWDGFDIARNLVPNGTYMYILNISIGETKFKETNFFSIIR